MANRLFGPDGEPIKKEGEPQILAARISGRPTVKGEPGEYLMQAEFQIDSADKFVFVAAQLRHVAATLRHADSVLKVPICKITVYTKRRFIPTVASLLDPFCKMTGGEVIRQFSQPADPPGEASTE